MNLKPIKKSGSQWKIVYWITVFLIFITLIFMVRFVLNSSKVYVEKSTLINPFMIEWSLERDGSLRINEPFFLKTDAKLIDDDLSDVFNDSSLFINKDSDRILKNLKSPYLIWKNAESDTIHVLKNNVAMHFLMQP